MGNHLKVLFVADYANQSDNVLQISQVQEGISRSMPGWKVSTHAVYGAFEDDDGNGSHLDGATAALKGERQVKRARVDMCFEVLVIICRILWLAWGKEASLWAYCDSLSWSR